MTSVLSRASFNYNECSGAIPSSACIPAREGTRLSTCPKAAAKPRLKADEARWKAKKVFLKARWTDVGAVCSRGSLQCLIFRRGRRDSKLGGIFGERLFSHPISITSATSQHSSRSCNTRSDFVAAQAFALPPLASSFNARLLAERGFHAPLEAFLVAHNTALLSVIYQCEYTTVREVGTYNRCLLSPKDSHPRDGGHRGRKLPVWVWSGEPRY